jgi:hypothetical protein
LKINPKANATCADMDYEGSFEKEVGSKAIPAMKVNNLVGSTSKNPQ